MNHKKRGFCNFSGVFLEFDVKICSKLINWMDEGEVLSLRDEMSTFLNKTYARLAEVKDEIKMYEDSLNERETSQETNQETKPKKGGKITENEF